MDDIIVIILTLVVAVFGLLGQSRKKKQGQENNNKAKSETDNFWNLFEEEPESILEHEQVKSEFIEDQETVNVKPETIEAEPPKYSFNAENEGLSIHETDLENRQKVKSVKKKKILKDFSLRKAVIYSEILNRKYN